MARPGKRKSSPSSKKPKLQPEQTGDKHAFWEDQAKKHGGSELATNPDPHYRDLEVNSILRVLGAMDHDTILDVGCGNGYTTHAMARKFPEATITGVDFSEAMIAEANKDANPNEEFLVGDVLSLSRNKKLGRNGFDVVVSSRCLINLDNWDEQKIGILEMRKMIKPGGHMILVENVQEGLDNLNSIRTALGLDEIKPRWHNKYLPQDEAQKFLAGMQGQLVHEYTENIGNFYYLASRVLYAKICKEEGKEPDYDNPINRVAATMPTMGELYACSPNFMIVLKKEGN